MTLNDLTPLTLEVARVADEAMAAPDGFAIWRGMVAGEEWKISVQHAPEGGEFNIRVKFRGGQ